MIELDLSLTLGIQKTNPRNVICTCFDKLTGHTYIYHSKIIPAHYHKQPKNLKVMNVYKIVSTGWPSNIYTLQS